MIDTLRNMPRYIRNTDAFGWQGADGPNGPWRSIAPPQSGTPWQPGSPMDDLRQASADVSGVEVLSPAAQAVLDAFLADWPDEPLAQDRCSLAAALRAAADQGSYCLDGSDYYVIAKDDILAIAAELEGSND